MSDVMSDVKPPAKKRIRPPRKSIRRGNVKPKDDRAHKPTPDLRIQVEAYATVGVPIKMIATLIGLGSENTLLKYYSEEVDLGAAKGLAKVANTLFKRATVDKDLGAAIFYLKVKGGWSERTVLQHEIGKETLEALVTGSMKRVEGPK